MDQNLIREQKQESLNERIKKLCLFDNDYMTKFFEDNVPCTELLLHVILDRSDLVVDEIRTQYHIQNLLGRSIKLDIYARDSAGKKHNIEVQRKDEGADPRRARYHSSIIDANTLLPGDDFKQLPESYVIFITENDIFGKNEPLYHIDRYIKEANEIFSDGAHIIYVNGAYKDESPLGKLMQDFSCEDPNNMNYQILADRARYFKEDKEGKKKMGGFRDEIIREEKMETAFHLLENGKLTVQEIADCLGLSVEDVKEASEMQPV